MAGPEPLWKPAERYSLSERADANTKFQDVPFNSRMKLVGQFSPAEVAEMEVEKAGENLITQALLGQTVDGVETEPETIARRDQAEALGAYIRAGVSPQDAARIVGLSDITFINATPITLKIPEDR